MKPGCFRVLQAWGAGLPPSIKPHINMLLPWNTVLRNLGLRPFRKHTLYLPEAPCLADFSTHFFSENQWFPELYYIFSKSYNFSFKQYFMYFHLQNRLIFSYLHYFLLSYLKMTFFHIRNNEVTMTSSWQK